MTDAEQDAAPDLRTKGGAMSEKAEELARKAAIAASDAGASFGAGAWPAGYGSEKWLEAATRAISRALDLPALVAAREERDAAEKYAVEITRERDALLTAADAAEARESALRAALLDYQHEWALWREKWTATIDTYSSLLERERAAAALVLETSAREVARLEKKRDQYREGSYRAAADQITHKRCENLEREIREEWQPRTERAELRADAAEYRTRLVRDRVEAAERERDALKAALGRIASGTCEQIDAGIRCDQVDTMESWTIADWCYPCQARAALATPAEPPAEKEPETAWLIERGQSMNQTPTIWWRGTGTSYEEVWTEDANKARHFPTKRDAEWVAQKQFEYGTRRASVTVTEHVFLDAPATEPTEGGGE